MLEILKFFLKEEWKSKYTVLGAFLFIFTAVLITYLSLPGMDRPNFTAIFWIVLIFTTLQGISKPFIQMRKNNYVFWHQICSPQVYLSARLVCSFLLMLVFTLFAFSIFLIMHGSEHAPSMPFILIAVFCGGGISSIFTVSSSIASKTDNPGILLPVLTFPVILPVLLVGIKAGKKAAEDVDLISLIPDLGILLAFNVLIAAMGLALIKFIWKE